MSDDSLIREVNEAVRQERYKKLWDTYGLYVLAGAFLIIAGVGGQRFWVYWQDKQAAEAGARFVGAVTLAEEGKDGEALQAFQDLAADAPSGYRVLARFQLAGALAKKGDRAGAVQAYDALAKDGQVAALLQGFAGIRAASLRVDEADYAEMRSRLDDLAVGTSAWRHSARELLGLAAYRTGNGDDAERYFSQLLADTNAPPNLRRRAEMMMALIVKADRGAAGTPSN